MSTTQIPSNQDIKQTLQSGQETLDRLKNAPVAVGEAPLMGKEAQIVDKTKQLLGDTEKLLTAKNADDKLQQFIIQGTKFLTDINSNVDLQNEFYNMLQGRMQLSLKGTALSQQQKNELMDKASSFWSNIRYVARELITSPELRNSLADLSDSFAQLFSLFAVYQGKFSQSLRQGDVSLEDFFYGSSSYDVGKSTVGVSSQEIKEKAKDVSQQAQQGGKELGGQFQKGREAWQEGDKEKLKESAQESWNIINSFKDQAWDNLSQDQKRQLNRIMYKLRSRVRGLFIRLSHNPNWSKAVRNLFDIFDILQYTLSDIKEKGQDVLQQQVLENKHWNAMWNQARLILDGFVGKDNVDNLVNSWKNLYYSVVNDADYQRLFSNWRGWFNDFLMNPEKLEDQDFQRAFDTMFDNAFKLRDKISPFLTSLQQFFYSAKSELTSSPETMRLVRHSQELFDMFRTGFDDPRMMAHLRNIFVAFLTDQLKNIPVPRIEDTYEGTFGTYDFILDNIVVNTFDVLPDFMYIRLLTDIDFDLKHMNANTNKSTATFTLRDMDANVKDIQFSYKKRGSDSYDSGLMDMVIKGAQIIIKLDINNPTNNYNIFSIRKIDVSIDSLSVTTKETKWSTLYNMFSTFFTGSIKQKLAEKIEYNVNSLVDQLNLRLNQIGTLMPSATSMTTSSLSTLSSGVSGILLPK